jgi:hypothetical protein
MLLSLFGFATAYRLWLESETAPPCLLFQSASNGVPRHSDLNAHMVRYQTNAGSALKLFISTIHRHAW